MSPLLKVLSEGLLTASFFPSFKKSSEGGWLVARPLLAPLLLLVGLEGERGQCGTVVTCTDWLLLGGRRKGQGRRRTWHACVLVAHPPTHLTCCSRSGESHIASRDGSGDQLRTSWGFSWPLGSRVPRPQQVLPSGRCSAETGRLVTSICVLSTVHKWSLGLLDHKWNEGRLPGNASQGKVNRSVTYHLRLIQCPNDPMNWLHKDRHCRPCVASTQHKSRPILQLIPFQGSVPLATKCSMTRLAVWVWLRTC